MKIVHTSGIRTLPGSSYPLADLYRDHLEEAVLAEELGFDCVWVSEHHFSPDAWNPSPFTFLAAVAARTERVRLGTYVLLLPLHNPVRIAEDVAVLDNISGGRVDLGVGTGSSPEEFRTFGIPLENRLGRTFEALRIIERCFAGGSCDPNLRKGAIVFGLPGLEHERYIGKRGIGVNPPPASLTKICPDGAPGTTSTTGPGFPIWG